MHYELQAKYITIVKLKKARTRKSWIFPPVCPLDILLNMKFEKDDDAWLADSTMATKLSIYSSKSLFEAILTKSRWTFQIYLQKKEQTSFLEKYFLSFSKCNRHGNSLLVWGYGSRI